MKKIMTEQQKKHKANYMKEYYARPEIKAKRKEYAKLPVRKAYMKQYYQSIEGRARSANNALKRMYGISMQNKKDIYNKQKGLCALCDNPLGKNMKSWHIDHNHKTKVIRGLLCFKCNSGLGLFNDDYILLKKALAYLKKYEI